MLLIRKLWVIQKTLKTMLDLNQFSHSHDSLEIIHRGHLSCVRKTFHSDLERAQRNVAKQRQFRPIYTGTAKVAAAEVIEFHMRSDSAELLMPYIEGITGHMFPVHATRNVAHTLSASLSTLLYAELTESREALVETSLFRDKLSSVSEATQDLALKQLVDNCTAVVDRFPAELLMPIGPCHGDLTLSNLILDPASGITLIDFLETFLETPLQDVAKLKQDFVYGWSFRKDPPALVIKAEILCHHHLPQAIVQIERMYPDQVRLLTMMTLARIAPYVTDSVTQRWLVRSLTDCLGATPQ
ncbi:phosphotransferase [Limnohabitans sp. Rim47]|uniref:phosphotransferase n=1 Tax=Limnohabitans sp. Rim47 TaxID=1100721 RepID=UPI0009DAA4CE|nr:phosphotransferase [Limnohabitans sp. Rim47]